MSITSPEKEPLVQFYLREKKLFYRGYTAIIPDDIIESFDKILPPFWWNNKDVLSLFTYYDDGSFSCERKKEVFDHSIQQKVERIYSFTSATIEQVRELVDIFIQVYEDCRLQNLQSAKDQIKDRIQKEFSLIVLNLKSFRSSLLSKSDWTQLPDNNLSDEIKDLWKQYRQYLRDITDDPNWWANNILLVDFPIDPENYLLRYPDKSVAYLSTPDQFENHAIMAVKAKLVTFLGYLGLHHLQTVGGYDRENVQNSNISQMTLEDLEFFKNPDAIQESSYEKLRAYVERKLKRISEDLSLAITVQESSLGACADSGTNLQSGMTPEAQIVYDAMIANNPPNRIIEVE